MCKSLPFDKAGGEGGGPEKRHPRKCFLETIQNHSRTPKHVLHLVWRVLGISTAIQTALKVALCDFLDGPPAPLNSQLMEKVNHYNCTKQIDFSMGPSVKFVLAIIDSISQNKWGLIFFLCYFPGSFVCLYRWKCSEREYYLHLQTHPVSGGSLYTSLNANTRI